MTDSDKRSDIEKKLDRLIHLAGELLHEHKEMPTDEAIEAYIFGEASDEQEQLVIGAVENSAAFRRELLEIMEDLKPYIETSSNSGDKVGQEDAINGGQAQNERGNSIWKSIKNYTGIRILLPATVVSVVTIILFVQPDDQELMWELVTVQVDPVELLSFDLRGSIDHRKLINYNNSQEAALEAFRQILTLGSEGIVIDTDYVNPEPSDQLDLLQVVVLADDKTLITHYKTNSNSDTTFQAWMLLLPSRNLMRINMFDDSVLTILPSESNEMGCITITSMSGSGWTFAHPSSFGK